MPECCDDKTADELRQRLAAVEERFERFKQLVHETATEYAERHDWCNVVNDALGELGLPGLERDYLTTVTVQLSLNLTTNGRSSDQAEQSVGTQDLADNIYALDRDTLRSAIGDYTIVESQPA